MRRACVDADLREPAAGAEHLVEAVHERAQLLYGAVLLAYLADLATNRDGDAGLLLLANQFGQLGAALVVVALLLLDRRERQIDQRRRVDVDVAVARGDRLADQLAQTTDDALR